MTKPTKPTQPQALDMRGEYRQELKHLHQKQKVHRRAEKAIPAVYQRAVRLVTKESDRSLANARRWMKREKRAIGKVIAATARRISITEGRLS